MRVAIASLYPTRSVALANVKQGGPYLQGSFRMKLKTFNLETLKIKTGKLHFCLPFLILPMHPLFKIKNSNYIKCIIFLKKVRIL